MKRYSVRWPHSLLTAVLLAQRLGRKSRTVLERGSRELQSAAARIWRHPAVLIGMDRTPTRGRQGSCGIWTVWCQWRFCVQHVPGRGEPTYLSPNTWPR